jgi:hypothetical protein
MRVVGKLGFSLGVIVLLFSFLSLLVSADCGGPLNPCTYCGDGEVQCLNDDGICEVCDGSAGNCGDGLLCNQDSCQCVDDPSDPCDYDGWNCEAGETCENCPSDCGECCTPDCVGKTCGSDGCGSYCPPYYNSCPSGTCYLGNCCTPSCPNPAAYSCTLWTPASSNGCGGTCAGFWGTKCPVGQSCNTQTHTCELHCTSHSQCDTGDVCRTGQCDFGTGDCYWEANTDASCDGGYCSASGTCVACTDTYCTTNFGCEYRCDAWGSCSDSTYSLCSHTAASCIFNPDTCACEVCDETEQCISHTLTYSCDQTCYPATCAYSCHAGSCCPATQTEACAGKDCGSYVLCGETTQRSCGTCGGATPVCQNGQCVSSTTYYRDADGDTYGNAGVTNTAGGSGWVLDATDCNDANAAINPGATEVCNGVDDDCDDLVDAADSSMTACPAGQSCQGGSCVDTGCSVNADCTDPNLPFCHTSSGDCVACLLDHNCAAQQCMVASCVNFQCSYVATPPDCPSPGEITCNDPIDPLNSCGSCQGTGTLCGEGEVCTSTGCDLQTVLVNPDPGNILALEGEAFTILVGLNPDDLDLIVDAEGMSGLVVGRPQGQDWQVSKVTGREDVGEHTITLTVFEIGFSDDPLGSYQVPVAVSCDTDNPCCLGYGYLTDNEPCELNGNPVGGYCSGDGECVENCIQNAYTACHEGNIHYFDSCDNVGDLSQSCSDDEVCTEQDGSAVCEPLPPSCTGVYDYFCRSGDVYRTDTGCGLTELSQECSVQERCVEQGTSASCEPLSSCQAYPGTIECADECVDPLTHRLHCGGCNRDCGRNEQCVQGMCELIPGCVVICDGNSDCDPGQVCVNAGSCTESECQNVNVFDQNETAIQVLATELLREGLVQVATAVEGNEFVFTATNLGPRTLSNVSVTTEFQKLIAASAQNLGVSGVNYIIIEDDPVLEFMIPELESEHTWRVQANNYARLKEEHLSLTTIMKILYSDPDLLAAWNETKDALTMGLNSEFDGENTKFHLTLNPNKNLRGLSVPIEIPKCMAKFVSEMNLEGEYRVVKDDPLIVWQFDEVSKPTAISFSVPKDIDEECKAQLKAMAIARKIGRPINPWLSILLVPLIGSLLIFFQRFGPHEHAKLSKKEFFDLAESQGQSRDDAEREWRDYKRRF